MKRGAVALIVVAGAMPQVARAQSPAAPPEVSPPPAPADESRRLDEIDQLARIALRKQELLEEEAARRAKESPKLTVDDKGLSFALPDGSYAVRLRGLVQGDGRFFAGDAALEANDTFVIRKLRLTLEGTLFSIVDFRLQPELAGTPQILDAYVDLHPLAALRLRAGKFKAPFGLERLQGDADRAFVEQTPLQNLSSQRDVGVQLWGDIAGGVVQYAAGVFNGAPDTTGLDGDTNHAKDFLGRLFVQPFRGGSRGALRNLGIGFSAGTGNRKGRLPTTTAAAVTGLAPFRTTGQGTFFSYLAPATDTTGAATVFAHERATRLNPQLFYYVSWFGLLAEYVRLTQGVQKGTSIAELTHQAAAATVSVSIGGREGWDGSTPDHPFDPAAGHWGALQLAARSSWLKLDDDTFPTFANPASSARSARTYGAAITWVLGRTVHYAASFEQTRFEGGAATADRPTENVVIGRAQVNF